MENLSVKLFYSTAKYASSNEIFRHFRCAAEKIENLLMEINGTRNGKSKPHLNVSHSFRLRR
jgi:hypothetical protein